MTAQPMDWRRRSPHELRLLRIVDALDMEAGYFAPSDPARKALARARRAVGTAVRSLREERNPQE